MDLAAFGVGWDVCCNVESIGAKVCEDVDILTGDDVGYCVGYTFTSVHSEDEMYKHSNKFLFGVNTFIPHMPLFTV